MSVPILGMNLSVYGIFISLSIALCIAILYKIRPRELENVSFFEAMIWVVVPAVVFARAWHVLTDFGLYENDLSRIIDISAGGLSVWGALLGGLIGIYAFTQLYGFNLKSSLNTAVVVVPLGQAIGRLGNYVNQELFGPPTDKPWGIFIRPENRPEKYMNFEHFHPAFLYEMIGDLVLFLVLLIIFYIISRKKSYKLKKTYLMVAVYLIGYGLVRFFVEFYRLERDFVGFLSFNQVVSISMLLIGVLYLLKLFTAKQSDKIKYESN